VLRQLGIVAMVGVLWGVLFLGYLRLTSPQAEVTSAADPEAVAVVITPTFMPSVPSPTPTHTATALVVAAPAVPTPTAAPEPAVGEISSLEPSPTPADTPVPSPIPTDAPAPSPTPTDTSAIPSSTPVPTEETDVVSFSGDVLPILQRRCVKCHGGERTEEGLILKTYADVMAGSWNGPVIEPGSAAESYLVEQIVSGEMPKKQPDLLPSEIRVISAWIDTGAANN
jgi:hypothetical protein